MPKENGMAMAIPARKKGIDSNRKNRANAGQAARRHRRRKGSNGMNRERRKARSNDGAAARTIQEKPPAGFRAKRARRRWRAIPDPPAPNSAWEMMRGTKWGQNRNERRRIRTISAARTAAESRKTAGSTRA